MKHKIAMSIEADVIKWVESQIRTGRFRNRSHGFEQCARLVRDMDIS